jgi:hypothetical protein
MAEVVVPAPGLFERAKQQRAHMCYYDIGILAVDKRQQKHHFTLYVKTHAHTLYRDMYIGLDYKKIVLPLF